MNLDIRTTPFAPLATLDLDALAERRSGRVSPALRPAFTTRGNATTVLERLFENDALCVTTGQQPGLFTGPLYSVYKALAAIALARTMERALDRPVVPVYWVAGDDHDFAEAGHIHLLTLANTVQQVTLRERQPDEPLVPLYRERLGPQVEQALQAIRDATPDTEFREGIMEWLGSHYTPERDFAEAFAGAMAALLGPHGLVVFRPTHPAAKGAMVPYLLRALEEAGGLDHALTQRAAALKAEGREVPVQVGDGATTVMCECELGRDRLVLNDGQFEARRSGRRWKLDELRRMARDAPERLSPNVLLRPVIEAALLPTVAYVAGPGELAYLAQCEPLYRALEIAPQAAVPRWSGVLLESRVTKVLAKYRIAPQDLNQPEGQLEAALLRDEVPPEGRDALAALRASLEHDHSRLEHAAVGIDPTLKKAVQHAKHGALKELDALEKKLISHLKKQNEIVLQQLDKARRNLFPLGQPQERVFNVTPFLIRYGGELLVRLVEAAQSYYDALDAARRRA